MFSLSPFSPVQLYEQVRPAPRIGRANEHPFSAPEQDTAASRKREQADRGAAAQEQALRGFGGSATLLSSALLAELGRHMALPAQSQATVTPEKETQGAALDKKRKSVEDDAESESEGISDASEADDASVGQGGLSGAAGGLRPKETSAQGGAVAQDASVTNEDAVSAEPDRSAFLVRLQRAKSVYAQGQMASGDYSFVRTAEVFQMVA